VEIYLHSPYDSRRDAYLSTGTTLPLPYNKILLHSDVSHVLEVHGVGQPEPLVHGPSSYVKRDQYFVLSNFMDQSR